MSPVRNQLVEMIDLMPEAEQLLLLEIARRFVPDDAAAPEDLADIAQARREYRQGETIPHDSIDWS